MPLRDLLVVGLIFGSLPVCVARPWVGVLIYTWMSLMNPHRYAWTFAVNFPVAMLPAVATLVGLALTRDRGPFPRGPHVTLLALLWGYFCFTTVFAINQYGAWDQLEKVSKVLFMVFVTLALINTPSKLRYYVLSLTLPIALIGLKGGVFALSSGGQYRVQGRGGSFIAALMTCAAVSSPLLQACSRSSASAGSPVSSDGRAHGR